MSVKHCSPSLSIALALCLALLSLSLLPMPLQAQSDANPADEDAALEEQLGNLPLYQLQAFVKAFSQIRSSYVEEVDDKTLFENAIKGMLTQLDPHSAYLEPQSMEDLQVSASGEFGGLGLEVGMENGFVKVIAPIDDTPAEKAGIESGDLIVRIDNKPVKGMTLNDAVKLMRGPEGSTLDLSIMREGVPQPIELTLTRAIISVISVRSRVLEEGYVYLRIAQFQGKTGADLRKALNSLAEETDIKGVVLDVRNNPGGVLQAAAEVVDAFIDEGTIVYTEGRIPSSESRIVATRADDTSHAPMVVLINGGSASASEIVAGALQDHNRAIVLGTTSFGKGSVQTVIPLSETHGMKLTTARYFTPSGRSIQAQGIEPDIEVERARITRIAPMGQLSESDLHGHLKNQDSKDGADNLPEASEAELITTDNQLYEALTLLKGLNIFQTRAGIEADNSGG